MEKVNIWDIEGTEFPAGRRTRVILGQNGAMEGSKFCQGYVVVYRAERGDKIIRARIVESESMKVFL